MAEKTKVTATDLVLENKKLQEENYSVKKDKTKLLLWGVIVSWLVFIPFLTWLAFFHFPQRETAWTSNAGAVCNLIPLTNFHVADSVAVNFAVKAAASTYTYDHKNWRKQLTDTADRYYIDDFRDSFIPAFADSKALQMVRANYFVVSSTIFPDKPALVQRKGKDMKHGGAAFWEVQVPLNITYTAGAKSSNEPTMATVRVMRVDQTRVNPDGLGIANISTSQFVN